MKDNKPKLTDFTPNTLQIDLQGRRAYWYFGVVVYVPKGYKWLAMDINGEVFAYEDKPTKGTYGFNTAVLKPYAPVQLMRSITTTLWLEENWFNSRIKVKDLKRFRCFAP